MTEVLDGLADLAASKWSAWLNNQDLTDRLLEDIADVVDMVVAFADPVLSGTASDDTWDPFEATWTS